MLKALLGIARQPSAQTVSRNELFSTLKSNNSLYLRVRYLSWNISETTYDLAAYTQMRLDPELVSLYDEVAGVCGLEIDRINDLHHGKEAEKIFIDEMIDVRVAEKHTRSYVSALAAVKPKVDAAEASYRAKLAKTGPVPDRPGKPKW